MDSGPRDGEHPASAQCSARNDDGLGPGRVLRRYGYVVLRLGVTCLVGFTVSLGGFPVIALCLVFALVVLSPAWLMGGVATIVGIGALIALLWTGDLGGGRRDRLSRRKWD